MASEPAPYSATLTPSEYGVWEIEVSYALEGSGVARATARGATPGRALDRALSRLKELVRVPHRDLKDVETLREDDTMYAEDAT